MLDCCVVVFVTFEFFAKISFFFSFFLSFFLFLFFLPAIGTLKDLGYYIDTSKEFARDAQNLGIIEMVFVPTAEQLADGMTKALPYPTFI